MRNSIGTVAAIVGLLTALSCDCATAQRMPDSEAEQYLWGGAGKPVLPSVVIDHTQVVRTEPEAARVALNPDFMTKQVTAPKFLAHSTVRVFTNGLLKEADIETVAQSVRDQLSKFHTVGVRFVEASDNPSGTENPFYAWLLFWDGRDTTRNIMLSADTAAKAASSAVQSLKEGEKIVGKWADANTFPGVFLLTVQGGVLYCRQLFSDGSGGEKRLLLKEAKTVKGVRRWDAVHSEGPDGVFKADGVGTDRFAIAIDGEALHVFDQDLKKPWLIGSPVGNHTDLSLLPSKK